ncbi:hypothetical protein CHS0354_008379 [Potamilus streckersoni]|uniref:Cytochrome oxidase complex assembly protein 1 n=1 Tax=Potamilus streckersoni TaxID=2493646 RepID=A0AAE0RPK2_9BIVA|nr:hypothetical protein CHS0354_008379 [Potamilus streckersoni]
MVRYETLKKIAIYGAFVSIGGAIYFHEKIQGNFTKAEYYKKSMKLLRMYKPAIEALGEPINSKKIDLGDASKNSVDGYKAHLTIPVKGPKGSGILQTWCSREKLGESWIVDRLDLELKADGRKWTFYQTPAKVNSTIVETPKLENS